jgi:beta-phosphoglucomutase-like phosphatase (HAD superfamily)
MCIAFIFDMDGVLFDSHPVHRIAWREPLREAGKKVSEAELDFILEGTTRDEILRHFLGP